VEITEEVGSRQTGKGFFDRIYRISDSFASARRNSRIENFYRRERREKKRYALEGKTKNSEVDLWDLCVLCG
jgi:hypothetical protein